MHYTKHFNINGVDTKQVACIELRGKPNAATEGALGVLGIDVTSPTYDVYKCVAVNGSIYTWELLSSGTSIIAATVKGDGVLNKTFAYSDLLYPEGYIVQRGDLILDSGGYLYRVTALGITSCSARYTGSHFGVEIVQETGLSETAVMSQKAVTNELNEASMRELAMIAAINNLSKIATSIDLSAYESSGQIVETYKDGSTKTTAVEFDENGNPIKITDSNGNETVVIW